MENVHKYMVAGHTFGITIPEGLMEDRILAPYVPFATDSDSPAIFSLKLEIVDSFDSRMLCKVVSCLNDEPPYFWIFEDADGQYVFGFSYSKEQPDCVLKISDSFAGSTVYILKESADRYADFAINNSSMLLYAFATSDYDTMLVHASVISWADGGYMFLGKSGTGKSTHSRLWLENIPETSLLNDDNPVIRMVDSKAYVYGSPWSGKTHCYKNEMYPLKAVVRLSQAPFNRIAALAPLQAFASLMPACSSKRWDSQSMAALHKSVEKVISAVPCYHLQCLPDADAASVCHSIVAR